MSTMQARELLRPGLLKGVAVLVAGASQHADSRDWPVGASAAACEQLGASVAVCGLTVEQSLHADDATIADAVRAAVGDAPVALAAVDGASLFAAAREGAGGEPRVALRACLDASWSVSRAVAQHTFLPDSRGGRIVYVAPFADAGEHADAARAGLENLARTLSIEWARHGVTTVAIAPGARTDAADAQAAGSTASEVAAAASEVAAAASEVAAAASEVAALAAYLASPAGSYFSGCLLDLRGPSPLGAA
jgi:NAD(P)-dependent dehydrogenase (short-subunit alcohol dehydrogenase family)